MYRSALAVATVVRGSVRVRWGRWTRRGWLAREAQPAGLPRRAVRSAGAPVPGADRRGTRTPGVMPRQVVPSTDAVDLTAAERAAFAGLVRRFGEGYR